MKKLILAVILAAIIPSSVSASDMTLDIQYVRIVQDWVKIGVTQSHKGPATCLVYDTSDNVVKIINHYASRPNQEIMSHVKGLDVSSASCSYDI